MYPGGEVSNELRTWTDSGWVGGVFSRKSCSGGHSQRDSGAALDSAVNRNSEGIGLRHSFLELFGQDGPKIHSVDVSACEGMLLRAGAGQVSTSAARPWAQCHPELRRGSAPGASRWEDRSDTSSETPQN